MCGAPSMPSSTDRAIGDEPKNDIDNGRFIVTNADSGQPIHTFVGDDGQPKKAPPILDPQDNSITGQNFERIRASMVAPLSPSPAPVSLSSGRRLRKSSSSLSVTPGRTRRSAGKSSLKIELGGDSPGGVGLNI